MAYKGNRKGPARRRNPNLGKSDDQIRAEKQAEAQRQAEEEERQRQNPSTTPVEQKKQQTDMEEGDFIDTGELDQKGNPQQFNLRDNLRTAWQSAKTLDYEGNNPLDKMSDIGAWAASNTIEAMVPQTKEELMLEMATLGQGKNLNLGRKLLTAAISDRVNAVRKWVDGKGWVLQTVDGAQIPWNDAAEYMRLGPLNFAARATNRIAGVNPGAGENFSPRPAWDEPLTNTFSRLTNDTKFKNVWGDETANAAQFLQDAYNHAWTSRTGDLSEGWGRKFTTKNGTVYKIKVNSNYDLNKGVGLKLQPMVSAQAQNAMARNWRSLDKAVVRDFFTKQGRPEMADEYIKYVQAGEKWLKRTVKDWNQWAGERLWSIGEGKAVSHGGPPVPNNQSIQLLSQNATNQNKQDFANQVLQALNNPISLQEDMAKFLDPNGLGKYWSDLNQPAKDKLIQYTTQGLEVDDALQRIANEGGSAFKSPFFENYTARPSDQVMGWKGKGSINQSGQFRRP